MNETALKNTVMHYLRTQGGLWEKRFQNAYTAPGTFDIVGCYFGNFVAIELKDPGKYKDPRGGLSPAQIAWEQLCLRAGGQTLVTDNLDDVKAFLESVLDR
jgi:hypothetical protein